MVPKNLRYTDSHEWVSLDADVCTVGITQFAVEQLTDVAGVDLKRVGTKLSVKSEFGVVESVKSVNDLFAPVAGEMIAKNEAAEKDPGIVTSDPYGKGWMVKIKMTAKADYDKLLTPEQYETQIASQGH